MGTHQVRLKYGTGVLELCVPESRFGGHRSLAELGEPRPDCVPRALDELCAAGFEEAIRGRRLGLLVADGTRAWDPAAMLTPLWPLLAGASGVDVFVCTGTHAPTSVVNRALLTRLERTLAGAPLAAEIVMHDCRSAELRSAGTTGRGTPVAVAARLERCAALLILADVKPHYFAGYSHPVKYVVPGLAGPETVRANHSLALEEDAAAGRHPWHPDPGRRANPLAEDLLEAFALVVGGRPHFALATLGRGPQPLRAWGGTTRAVCEAAFPAADELFGYRLEPARFLVVSPGGAPHDESLYTAQRALELSAAAWRRGGEVLFLAECAGGLGPPGSRANFFEPLCRPLAEIRPPSRADYVLYGHKPVKLARLLERAAALWIRSTLSAEDLRRAHLRPVDDAQAVIDDWARRAGPDDRIACVDDASTLLALPPGPSPAQVPIE